MPKATAAAIGTGEPTPLRQPGTAAGGLTPVVRTTLTADICRKMVGQLIRGA